MYMFAGGPLCVNEFPHVLGRHDHLKVETLKYLKNLKYLKQQK